MRLKFQATIGIQKKVWIKIGIRPKIVAFFEMKKFQTKVETRPKIDAFNGI